MLREGKNLWVWAAVGEAERFNRAIGLIVLPKRRPRARASQNQGREYRDAVALVKRVIKQESPTEGGVYSAAFMMDWPGREAEYCRSARETLDALVVAVRTVESVNPVALRDEHDIDSTVRILMLRIAKYCPPPTSTAAGGAAAGTGTGTDGTATATGTTDGAATGGGGGTGGTSNGAPSLAGVGPQALKFTEGEPAKPIANAVTITDPDSPQLVGALVRVVTNFHVGEDSLDFTNQLGITGTFDPSTGTLTLSGVAPLADYQAALRSVGYLNSSSTPSTDTRTIDLRVNDGTTNSNSPHARRHRLRQRHPAEPLRNGSDRRVLRRQRQRW